jgi:hypothetical protein
MEDATGRAANCLKIRRVLRGGQSRCGVLVNRHAGCAPGIHSNLHPSINDTYDVSTELIGWALKPAWFAFLSIYSIAPESLVKYQSLHRHCRYGYQPLESRSHSAAIVLVSAMSPVLARDINTVIGCRRESRCRRKDYSAKAWHVSPSMPIRPKP